MLHPAQHILIEFRSGIEVIEPLNLVPMLKPLGACGDGVRFEQHEFFALVFAELSAEEQLLFG